MTKQEMEQTVAKLLAKQREFKRLGVDLGPKDLLLLQRLLYRLGWTKMNRSSKSIKYSQLVNADPNKPGIYGKAPSSIRGWKVVRGFKPVEHNGKYIWQSAGGAVPHNEAEHGNWDKLLEARELHGEPLSEHYLWAYGLGGKAPEVGEVDWRPNETIPEDYYSMHRRTKSIKYARLTLGKPRPGVSFGGEPINEHDLHDELGKVVGNIKVRDRGPMLHVDWIGGKGLHAGSNLLGNEAMRSVHDAIAAHYPNAQYVTGHRISGFRGKQTTGERVVIPIRRRNKMSRSSKPIRYALIQKGRDKPHALIEGFPIAHLLYKTANDPKNGKNIRSISKHIYKTGDRSALWGLHDLVQNPDEHKYGHEHPVIKAGYNLLNAADKIGLDAKTHEAMTHLANQDKEGLPPELTSGQWMYTPEYQADRAGMYLRTPHAGADVEYREQLREHLNRLRDEVKFRSSQTPNDQIDESILRHHHRAMYKWAKDHNTIGHSLVESHNEDSLKPIKDIPSYLRESSKATRYKKKPRKYSLANKSNFIGALLKASSPEHKMFVKRTSELAKRIGASKTKQFPALHDTPNQSVPGVAMAVYGHVQPNAAHALGSWINGLLLEDPGYALFYARPTGIDKLYRLRMEGSGYDVRSKLDRAGISSRVFVPHKKGLDVLIPDKGSRMGNTIQSFAQQQKVPIEVSNGHFSVVGSQDQAQARSTFRNNIVKHESGNNMNQLQRRISVRRYATVPYLPQGIRTGPPPILPRFPPGTVGGMKTRNSVTPIVQRGYTPKPNVYYPGSSAEKEFLRNTLPPTKATLKPRGSNGEQDSLAYPQPGKGAGIKPPNYKEPPKGNTPIRNPPINRPINLPKRPIRPNPIPSKFEQRRLSLISSNVKRYAVRVKEDYHEPAWDKVEQPSTPSKNKPAPNAKYLGYQPGLLPPTPETYNEPPNYNKPKPPSLSKPKITQPDYSTPKFDTKIHDNAGKILGDRLGLPPHKSEPAPNAKYLGYQPGLLPPTPEVYNEPPKYPKNNKVALFDSKEMNRLHHWATNHAMKNENINGFGKFLGLDPIKDRQRIFKILQESIMNAAHEVRRNGNKSTVIPIGNTGKRLKINIPHRTNWNDINPTSKTVKLPKNKPIKEQENKYSRRRRIHSMLNKEYILDAHN